jgi:hypothetical protein
MKKTKKQKAAIARADRKALADLIRIVGPEVTAATWAKVAKAHEAKLKEAAEKCADIDQRMLRNAE